MLVLLLPSDVITSIFLEWISLEELGKLDCSLTNSKFRNQFLVELRRDAIVYDGLDKTNVNYYAWLHLRGLKVNKLNICRESIEGNYMCNIAEQFSFVQQLSLYSLYSEDVTDGLIAEMNKCMELKSLAMCSMPDLQRCEYILDVPNPTLLQSVSFDGTQVLRMNMLQLLSQTCPNIAKLCLCYVHNLNDFYNCCFANLKKLTIGQCTDMATFIDYIIHESHKIESISCYCHSDLEGTEMNFTKLSTQASHLKTFSICNTKCLISTLKQLLTNASSLQHLSIAKQCYMHEGFQSVASKCLESLFIEINGIEEQKAVVQFLDAKGSTLQRIIIHLASNNQLSKVLSTKIKENCTLLKELELNFYCDSVCLVELLKANQYIQRLNIRFCKMTVEEFCQLAPHCNSLVEIAFRLESIDEQVVDCFMNYFPRLSVVRLFNEWKRLNEYETIQLNILENARRDVDFTKRF